MRKPACWISLIALWLLVAVILATGLQVERMLQVVTSFCQSVSQEPSGFVVLVVPPAVLLLFFLAAHWRLEFGLRARAYGGLDYLLYRKRAGHLGQASAENVEAAPQLPDCPEVRMMSLAHRSSFSAADGIDRLLRKKRAGAWRRLKAIDLAG